MALSSRHINWLDFGTFQGTCLLVCGFSYEAVSDHFKKKKTPKEWVEAFESTKNMWDSDNWGFASRRQTDSGQICFFLTLKHRFDFKDDSHVKLAHEILHLASFQLADFLDPIKENECFAYTHTHLMRQCYKILRS
jgi:hypothetical protein